MRKFLTSIKVISVRTYKDVLGRNQKEKRINPYNPLSYLFIILITIVAFFWIGINGIIENSYNPFKWQ